MRIGILELSEYTMRKPWAGFLIRFLLLPFPLSAQKEPPRQPQYNVQVNLVSLDVEVLDQDGNLVQGLTQSDFAVEENGKPMEISNFAISTDRPLSLAVVLDTSALSATQLGICKNFLLIFAHKLDRSDELCLYSFDSRDAYLEQDLTSDRPLLMTALENIGVPSRRSGGMMKELLGAIPPTGLAIDLALRRLEGAHNPKKALLLISNRFRGSGQATVEHIQQSGCTLLTLAFPHKASMIVPLGGDAITTSQLRRESGGRQFSAQGQDIDVTSRQIAYSLKNYYSIAYLTEIKAGDKKPRKIRVHVPGRKYTINFRRTYIPQ
jgi:VWFA-related protein